MNENAKKWVAALRSGEYEQGHRALCETDIESGEYFYCCLGVACELAVGEGVIGPATNSGNGKLSFQGERNYLPSEVRDWLGLRDGDGSFSLSKAIPAHSLDVLNDDYNYTFEDIADFIESEPEGLFVEEATK